MRCYWFIHKVFCACVTLSPLHIKAATLYRPEHSTLPSSNEMCLPVLNEVVADSAYNADIDMDMEDEESESDSNLECSTCEETIEDDEEVFILECGCAHHLTCLIDELDVLEVCPMCEELLEELDYTLLEEARNNTMNEEV